MYLNESQMAESSIAKFTKINVDFWEKIGVIPKHFTKNIWNSKIIHHSKTEVGSVLRMFEQEMIAVSRPRAKIQTVGATVEKVLQ